jgi:hypothetical protein
MSLTLLVASGVALALTKIGGPGPDTLRGTNGNDNLLGEGGNDILFALRGQDTLLGGPGKDVVAGGNKVRPLGGDKNLVGGPGKDILFSGNGSDNIVGNKGNDYPATCCLADKLSAGDGNDVVGVFNNPAAKDTVSCSSGFDRVFADKKDAVAPNCEKVADTGPERDQLDIPQSFWKGLPDF